MPDLLFAVERPVDQYLDELGPNAHVLSRRQVGQFTAQHMVIARSGVWVIASRRSPSRRAPQGGMLSRRTETLRLGRRDGAHLVEGVRKQADIVRGELSRDIPVAAMLCILDADWPLFGGAFTVDGVRVLWPKKASQVIRSGATFTVADVTRLAEELDSTFPPASSSRSHGRRR